MSSSNDSAGLIAWWNNASDSVNRYGPIFIYIFGIFGNFLNILVLAQKPLRSTPSVNFFIVTSIAGLIAIISGLTSRMMAGYAVDLTNTITWICIVRNYVLYSARTVALYMIALATIDRWFSSNADVNLRHISTLKNAQRGMIIVICLSSVTYARLLYCFEANLTNTLIKWYGKTLWCRLIYDLEFIFLLCCYSFISDVCLWIDDYYQCLSSSFASNTTCHCDSNDSNSTCR